MLKSKIVPFTIKRLLCHIAKENSKDTDYLLFRKYGPVALIGLNRPSKRNALNEAMIKDLANTITEIENDDSIAIGVIHGEGGNFCSGYDLEELAENDKIPQTFIFNNLTEKYVRKPLIAAVNGYAVGLGFDLALWCDLRVMDETAVFGCLGRRFGTSMSESGIARLNIIVGMSVAADLLITGRSIKSEEALHCGLANRVVACGTAVGQAINLATSITKFPLPGILSDRAMLYKHAFAKIPLKNSTIDEDSVLYKEQVITDSKKGAKLFKQGFGKSGQLFPYYIWEKM